jgi:LysM repeat protein
MMPTLTRSIGRAAFALPVIALMALTSCGGDDEAGTTTVVQIQPQSYNTQPQVLPSSTAAGGAPAGAPGAVAGIEQVYTVRSNDTLSGIATRYGITIDDVANYNSWSEGTNHVLQPGDEVKIPPQAKIPDEATADTSDGSNSGAEDTMAPALSDEKPRCPNGDLQGTYEVQATDQSRAAVASRLDVTVQELDAANANTSGYQAFYPGLEILVPCPGDASAGTA